MAFDTIPDNSSKIKLIFLFLPANSLRLLALDIRVCIDVPQPLSNDLWVFLLQKINKERLK